MSDLVKTKILISTTISKVVELDIPKDADRVQMCEAFNDSPHYDELKSLWDAHWDEDEFEIMRYEEGY